jgi:hypothetical protein
MVKMIPKTGSKIKSKSRIRKMIKSRIKIKSRTASRYWGQDGDTVRKVKGPPT